MTVCLNEKVEDNAQQLPLPQSALNAVTRLKDGGLERQGFFELDRNERLSPLPDSYIEEIRKRITSQVITGYPILETLYQKLSIAIGIPRSRLLLTAGSDAAIKAIFQVYSQPGNIALMLNPSYAMYPVYARMFSMQAHQVDYRDDLSAPHADFLNAIRPGVSLVMLANPNQPTGNSLEREFLRETIVRAAAVRALVVVDEAYHPFSQSTVLPWTEEFRNLVVLRTFSKAWGLAGLRIGFVAADSEVVVNMTKVRSAYDVNSMAALCGEIALDHPEVADDYVELINRGRELIRARLSKLGLEAPPSDTNFQIIRLVGKADPGLVVEALRKRRWLVKGPFTARCLEDCIRITLGPPSLMERFADALEEVMNDVS